ncbi:MAG: YccF domain-containing protein [Prevotella sp.]|nr:YccF domain-containing protein [Staphylococcus sp.]MCM1350040.1 YccF domain-containing protein [Prevotella sp.]
MSKQKQTGCLTILGNIIWIITGGIGTALGWLLIGVLLCITIIGIPFGKQCFKLATITLSPFGKEVKLDFGKHPIMNVVWLVLFGWEMFLAYIFNGILLCITIIGIPFGIQAFKFGKLAIFPFGAKVQ